MTKIPTGRLHNKGADKLRTPSKPNKITMISRQEAPYYLAQSRGIRYSSILTYLALFMWDISS